MEDSHLTPEGGPAGAPKSWNRTDQDTLKAIDRWIQSLHPDYCEDAARQVFGLGTPFMTTASRLASHCILEHDIGLKRLALLDSGSIHYHPSQVGLAAAVRTKQERIVAQFEQWGQLLEGEPGGPLLANVIARNVDDDHFERIWGLLWQGGVATSAPGVAGMVLRAGAFDSERAPRICRFLEGNLNLAFQILDHELVFVLLHAEPLGCRDDTLSALVERYGLVAARLILELTEGVAWIPSCVPAATRLVLDEDPDHPSVAIGVAHCLKADPEFALQVIAYWATHGDSRHLYHSFLIYQVGRWEQSRVLESIAEATLEEEDYRHSQIAGSLRHLVTDVPSVVDWVRGHLDEPRAARFASGLALRYLSEPRGAPGGTLANFRDLAGELHARYGQTPRGEVLKEWNLTDPNMADFEDLAAIALARDVAEPRRLLNAEIVLRNIKQYPFTYRALGGDALDDMIAQDELPVQASIYGQDITEERARDAERLLRGDMTPRAFEVLERIRRSEESSRQVWEERFRNISTQTDGYTPNESKRLREDEYTLTEVVVLERLLPFFEVIREPEKVPGLKGKRLDFLLRTEDGELLLEVTTIGVKPEDVREGVKTSTGGQTKNKLLEKWRTQLAECKSDVPLPVVIAVTPQWAHDLVFDFTNSLYGPVAFSYVMDTERQEVVAEGTTREAERAFFAIEGVECISAVAGISLQGRSERAFGGRLFRPLRAPRTPLSPRLWVRLRTALYGPRPEACMEEMSRIPDITSGEVEALVDHGVDDLSFFAREQIPRPDELPISEQRYQELMKGARYLLTLLASGRISDLRTAQGQDLGSLEQQGILLVRQLLDLSEAPEGFSSELWIAMQEEARTVLEES